MVGRRRSRARQWDRDALEPAIRKSICTGEETFGCVRRADGSFMDISIEDLREERKYIKISFSMHLEA